MPVTNWPGGHFLSALPVVAGVEGPLPEGTPPPVAATCTCTGGNEARGEMVLLVPTFSIDARYTVPGATLRGTMMTKCPGPLPPPTMAGRAPSGGCGGST